jgi:hypothetical protein
MIFLWYEIEQTSYDNGCGCSDLIAWLKLTKVSSQLMSKRLGCTLNYF